MLVEIKTEVVLEVKNLKPAANPHLVAYLESDISYSTNLFASELPYFTISSNSKSIGTTTVAELFIQLVHRLKALVEYFRMGLDCFFTVWFVVRKIWIFGGHSSSSEAPNLHRLCIVFLIFCCIGYAIPFILCAKICCCLPCTVSVPGFGEDLNPAKGAAVELINALPTYKFKFKKNRNGDNMGASEFGVMAVGTEKERVISGEDAVRFQGISSSFNDVCFCRSYFLNSAFMT
ncbi:hypothetical protein Nepgr_001486 [Nepenthes gracilis]|uniref:Uncharacterized protein n=1 Tax=Nepenthes gracilis TaxID=150966 RepID=A0AAD3P8L0_NEPGR|nr:hypothetical protein Nepgr_001486 [Nepenthes gracilis]